MGLRTIAERITARGFRASPGVIAQVLSGTLGIGRRKIAKDIPLGSSEFRQSQFDRIAELRSQYESLGWPVVSVDTKKKELLGCFSRPGKAWTDGTLHAFDHDFGSYSNSEKAIPYGVFDTVANDGFIYLATGADTGELAADALRRWWLRLGRSKYAGAKVNLL